MWALRSKFVAALSRQTSGRKLIPEIDGLRSVAILSVVFFHASGNFWVYTDMESSGTWLDAFMIEICKAGEYGVPLFFAISGFILATPFASHHLFGERRVPLKRYFLRRLTRLEPPYIFALTVFFVIAVVRSGGLELLPNYLASCVYLHNIIYSGPSKIMVVAWSLEVEVQFYILAPLVTMVFAIRSAVVRRTILAFAILAFSWFFGVEKPIQGRSLIEQASYFLVGLMLADLYLTSNMSDPDSKPARTAAGLGWDVIAIASLSLVFLVKAYGAPYHIRPEVASPWLILTGYVAVFKARFARWLFRAIPVVILGGMCYTIYLWHFPVIALYRHGFAEVFDLEPVLWMRVLYVLTAAAFAVGFSAILFALIERPTMDPKWPSKLAARLRLARREPTSP